MLEIVSLDKEVVLTVEGDRDVYQVNCHRDPAKESTKTQPGVKNIIIVLQKSHLKNAPHTDLPPSAVNPNIMTNKLYTHKNWPT